MTPEPRSYDLSKSRRRNKPKDPAEIARLAFEERRRRGNPADWGHNEEALKLKANQDVETTQDRSVEGKRRIRYDIFARLYYGPGSKLSTPAYDAVRRLQADIAVLHRTQGASDAIRNAGAAQTGALAVVATNFSLTQREAGERVALVLNGGRLPSGRTTPGMTPWCARLMRGLCETEATRGETPNWQAIVQRCTGELRRLARYDHVRTAAEDLAASYGRIDNEPKERAA